MTNRVLTWCWLGTVPLGALGWQEELRISLIKAGWWAPLGLSACLEGTLSYTSQSRCQDRGGLAQ